MLDLQRTNPNQFNGTTTADINESNAYDEVNNEAINNQSVDDLQKTLELTRAKTIRLVQNGIAELLNKYNCRLTTNQVIVDGVPGPIQVVVACKF